MASNPYPSIGSSVNHQTAPLAETLESEAEDEVDQLESDSEVEETGNDASAKKNEQGAGQRTPGQTLLPAVRLENIIQAEGMCSPKLLLGRLLKECCGLPGVTGSLALSKEGLFILSVATVCFLDF